MASLMEADVAAACGPRGKHNPDRAATRHGTERGSVTLGGRRVPVTRPRIRTVEGTGELPVPAARCGRVARLGETATPAHAQGNHCAAASASAR